MNNPQVQLSVTPMVKKLLIINIGIWVCVQLLLEGYGGIHLTNKYFALNPGKFIYEFALWQPLTYMFFHSMQINHILFNMLMLWFVGVPLEQRWGGKAFLGYYLISGAGAAILYTAVIAIYSMITGVQTGLMIPVIGASGALFGLLVAFGIIFSDSQMYFMMLFPMKAKYFVMILGGVEVLSMLSSGVTGGEVAYLAHIGGLLSGYITLVVWTKLQQAGWRKAHKKKGSGRLRLVVDNDETKGKNNDPKYWN